MRPYPLIALLHFATLSAYTQYVFNPGGVKSPAHWYVTDTSASKPCFRSVQKGKPASIVLDSNSSTLSFLNFYPALVFSEKTQIGIPLESTVFNTSSSFFTVSQTADTIGEKHIWNIAKEKKVDLILTTKRMADLTDYHYMNFIDLAPSHPKVNIYVHQKQTTISNTGAGKWNIGVKTSLLQLPISSFKGLIPEIIAYDRVLTRQERLRVASYLALKYGITLTEPEATYLNSSGEKIWDGYEYSAYHHNIAGIGRDDSSGLQQMQATSSNNPGLLYVSTNEKLSNNSFLLWGDNGLLLIPDNKLAGVPQLLKKKWLMIASGNKQPLSTEVILDTKQIDAPLPPKPVYWLAIDRSGMGDFTLSEIEFIRMDRIDVNGNAHFNGIIWNKENSGKEVLACFVAQNLVLSTNITYPTCTSPDNGGLQVKIIGGTAPFQLIIQNASGQFVNHQTVVADKIASVEGLRAGKYFLKVSDAIQQAYIDSFYIINSDAPFPSTLESNYMLTTGFPLHIDASEQMPFGITYAWAGPDNFQATSPEIIIAKPGTYSLTCSKNGCSASQDFVVNKVPDNTLSNAVSIYPNPSHGSFTIKISLPEPAAVKMMIYNTNGQVMKTREMHGFANYTIISEIMSAGIYKLVLESGSSSITKKLIIIK